VSERLSPPQLAWAAHGSPVVGDCEPASGRCYVCCGVVERGKQVQSWLGSNYTDQNRARFPTASHVCEACCYVHSRTSPVLGRPPKEDKKFGGNYRNYSHLYEEGWAGPVFGDDGSTAKSYANASKGQKGLIRNFLAREHTGPWFAAIADSGQKHVLPFAPLNGAGRSGLVIFEEAMVTVPDDQSLLSDMIALLSAGVTKDEIGSGNWYTRTMIENREPTLAFEAKWGAHRGGDWFRLAIWLAQRDEEAFKAVETARKEKVDARRKTKKTTGNADRGANSKPTGSVPKRRRRQAANELLGTDPKPMPGSSPPVDDGKRVGERSPKAASNPGASQVRLPGFD